MRINTKYLICDGEQPTSSIGARALMEEESKYMYCTYMEVDNDEIGFGSLVYGCNDVLLNI